MLFDKSRRNIFIISGVIFAAVLSIFSYNYMRYDKSKADIQYVSHSNSIDKAGSKAKSVGIQPSKPENVTYVNAYICGSVRKPGVYRVQSNTMINKLIVLAGGLMSQADITRVNLARKASDGEKIYIPYKGQKDEDVVKLNGDSTLNKVNAAQPMSSNGQVKGKVNINTATSEELQTVPGIGAARAKAIIDYRTSNGGFKSIDELDNVNRIGKKTIDGWKDYICIN